MGSNVFLILIEYRGDLTDGILVMHFATRINYQIREAPVPGRRALKRRSGPLFIGAEVIAT